MGLVWRGEREEREREKARVLRGCAGLGLAVQRGHHVVELHRRAVDLPFFRPAAAGQFDTTGERRFAGGLSVQRYWKGRWVSTTPLERPAVSRAACQCNATGKGGGSTRPTAVPSALEFRRYKPVAQWRNGYSKRLHRCTCVSPPSTTVTDCTPATLAIQKVTPRARGSDASVFQGVFLSVFLGVFLSPGRAPANRSPTGR